MPELPRNITIRTEEEGPIWGIVVLLIVGPLVTALVWCLSEGWIW